MSPARIVERENGFVNVNRVMGLGLHEVLTYNYPNRRVEFEVSPDGSKTMIRNFPVTRMVEKVRHGGLMHTRTPIYGRPEVMVVGDGETTEVANFSAPVGPFGSEARISITVSHQVSPGSI